MSLLTLYAKFYLKVHFSWENSHSFYSMLKKKVFAPKVLKITALEVECML